MLDKELDLWSYITMKAQEDIIQEFCIKLYDKAPIKFGRYMDWEVYGILWMVQIPYSTAIHYNELRDKYTNSALIVNSNWVLQFWIMKNKRFIKI